jgi:hypothetical protein
MMPDPVITIFLEKLCREFCTYYKSSKNNELACMGYIVAERLLNKNVNIPFDKPEKLDVVTEKKLAQSLCPACPFYENDCDFVQSGLAPCGGFILLGNLLEKNTISIDDIRNII